MSEQLKLEIPHNENEVRCILADRKCERYKCWAYDCNDFGEGHISKQAHYEAFFKMVKEFNLNIYGMEVIMSKREEEEEEE